MIRLFNLLLAYSLFITPTSPLLASPPPITEAMKEAVIEEIYNVGLVRFKAADLVFRPALDMHGVYETRLGAYIFQISDDASMLLRGDLFYTDAGELLDAQQRNQIRRESLALLDEAQMIIYPTQGKPRYCLTVFIDVQCEYCAKLHHDLPRLNAAGVRVRFLAFPREGLDTPNYQDTVAVWCAPDRAEALARLEAGKSIEKLTCDNAVAAHFYLGEAFQVEGTPTLVFANGHMQAGYPGFKRLLRLLERHKIPQAP